MIKTKRIKVGDIYIGGSHNIVIQSMTNTKTSDIEGTISQILELERHGCELIRVSIPDDGSAEAIKEIKKKINIPLVADIHFDYRLAIKAIKYGADKLRINPGNIGNIDNVKLIIEKAKSYNVPIRIGVNSGSLDKNILEKYGKLCPEAMVESVLDYISLFEKLEFYNIVISIKSSNVKMMYDAYKLLHTKTDYPLHLGVTEAGTFFQGSIKSAIGIGSLLLEGIGDTIRVSLTENPVEEIKVAKEILKVLGIRKEGIEIISCPTCSRTEIDLISLVKEAEKMFCDIKKPLKVAIMGCVVNGPGEAREADVGVAVSKAVGVIFKEGKILKQVPKDKILEELKKTVYEML